MRYLFINFCDNTFCDNLMNLSKPFFSVESLSNVYFLEDQFFRMTSEMYKGYLKYEHCVGDDENFWMTAGQIYVEQRSVLFRIIGFHYFYIPIFEFVHISRRYWNE